MIGGFLHQTSGILPECSHASCASESDFDFTSEDDHRHFTAACGMLEHFIEAAWI